MREVFRTASEPDTIALGERLAARLAPGTVVVLTGQLGAGKTTLAKGIVRGLGAAEPDEVSSPTFILIHEYGDPPRVYHVDLYRLDDAGQVEGLGIEELFGGDAVVLIEWGERFPELLPAHHVEIELRRLGEEEREIEFRAAPAEGSAE